jgi:hypothetical protein
MVNKQALTAISAFDTLLDAQRLEIKKLRTQLIKQPKPPRHQHFPLHEPEECLQAALRAVVALTARKPDIPITLASDPRRVYVFVAEAIIAYAKEARKEGELLAKSGATRRIEPDALPLVSELIQKLDETIR